MVYKGNEEDRRFVALSTGELEDYLSSGVLLWRVKGTDLPLTPGNLLLAMKRLSRINDPLWQTESERIDCMINRKRGAWEKKVDQELSMRLNQWRDQVEQVSHYGGIDASYRYQVRTRLILDLLMAEKRYNNEDTHLALEKVDQDLSLLTDRGDFIWDESLKDGFPENQYPYLYIKEKS